MLASLACFVALASAVAAAPAASLAVPAGFTVTGITFTGTGCPSGSTIIASTADKSAHIATYSQFYAEGAPGIPVSSGHLTCTVSLAATVPVGYQLGIQKIEHRGYVELTSGAKVSKSSVYTFTGSATQATSSANYLGPASQDIVTSDSYTPANTIKSPCGSNTALNIVTDVDYDTTVAGASGYIAEDSLDIHFQFLSC
ncbi:hypothetical protein DFP72DRAFT_72015 [Ephemerocybe angulata]|uniref:Secreted protein n=1 Tax=Ephemerocybe angulata TaxID=980116 RepID=A0A8H6I9M0_9AGAR|nr:hypothetical protein DFP72DRAFT_72015 [Tulosesus angulatus]